MAGQRHYHSEVIGEKEKKTGNCYVLATFHYIIYGTVAIRLNLLVLRSRKLDGHQHRGLLKDK